MSGVGGGDTTRERVAEAMMVDYYAQMDADNDGSPLPYIDWLNLADAAIQALGLTTEYQVAANAALHQGSQPVQAQRLVGPWVSVREEQ